MSFAHPLWLIVGLFFCSGLLLLALQLERSRRTKLRRFSAAHLLTKLTGSLSLRRRRLKLLLLLSAVFLLFTALARPQYGERWIDVHSKGIDILFAVDTSASMLARDIRPNRLARARFAILDFISRLEGDRVGLLPFAGRAFLLCPLTGDYNAFAESLQALDSKLIPEEGTNLAAAINEAGAVLANDANHKLLIIVTDGENLAGDAVQAARRAARDGMTIFTVGVGTAAGELIPAPDGDGFLKDESGRFVVSRLDEKTLQTIAQATGGLYAPLGRRGEGLQTIYRRKLALVPATELAEKRRKVPIERFPWCLGAALVLLLLEFILSDRSNGAASLRLPWRRFGKKTAVLLLPLLFLPRPPAALASPPLEAYTHQDYETARQEYRRRLDKQPDNALLNYNYATSAYKSGRLEEAVESFDKALHSDDPALQEKAYFNRGNAHFKAGRGSLEDEPQKTVQRWQQALDSYAAALALNPDNEQARHNHDLVAKKLAALRERLQQERNSAPEKQEDADKQEQKEGDGRQNPRKNAKKDDRQGDQAKKNNKQSEQNPKDGTQGEQNTAGATRPQGPEKPPKEGAGSAAQESAAKLDGHLPEPGKREDRDVMSREEALQLLREMKNEEKTLRLVPQAEQQNNSEGGTTGRW